MERRLCQRPWHDGGYRTNTNHGSLRQPSAELEDEARPEEPEYKAILDATELPRA